MAHELMTKRYDAVAITASRRGGWRRDIELTHLAKSTARYDLSKGVSVAGLGTRAESNRRRFAGLRQNGEELRRAYAGD